MASPEPYVVQGEAVRVERVARVRFCNDGFKLIQRDDRVSQEPRSLSKYPV